MPMRVQCATRPGRVTQGRFSYYLRENRTQVCKIFSYRHVAFMWPVAHDTSHEDAESLERANGLRPRAGRLYYTVYPGRQRCGKTR